MRKPLPLWAIAFLCVSAGAAAADRGMIPASSPGVAEPEADEDLRLGAEDLLQIHVFEFPELGLRVRISENGTIALPLLGQVPAGGLTVAQLRDQLEALLEERYLRDPQVSIFVDEHGSRKVSILGEVARPGMYQLLGARTVLQVLSQAGGLTDEAGDELILHRAGENGARSSVSISIEELMEKADPALDVSVRPGDTITVPRGEWIHVYVDGAVRAPGRLDQEAKTPMSLLQALTRAGGPTDRANIRSVKVLRHGEDGSLEEALVVNLKKVRKGKQKNPLLQDGDVVVVPEALF